MNRLEIRLRLSEALLSNAGALLRDGRRRQQAKETIESLEEFVLDCEEGAKPKAAKRGRKLSQEPKESPETESADKTEAGSPLD